MKCISMPPLDEEQLVRYVDGQASDSVVAHLGQCAYCRERAGQLARFQKGLRRQLYRSLCPSPMELGEYRLGYLNAGAARTVQQHLAGCPHCRAEIGKFAKSSGEWALQPDLLDPVRRLIAQLMSGGTATQVPGVPPLVPAFGGLRGDDEEPLIYQADGIRIVIEVQDDVEQMGFKTLLGLVTGLETNELTIQVSQGDQVVTTTSVDEIGNFIISHLSPGHYTLILTGPNMEIHIQSLSVI